MVMCHGAVMFMKLEDCKTKRNFAMIQIHKAMRLCVMNTIFVKCMRSVTRVKLVRMFMIVAGLLASEKSARAQCKMLSPRPSRIGAVNNANACTRMRMRASESMSW